MPKLTIPDEVLKEAGLSESEALVEFACRLYDAGKISLWTAAKLAVLDRNGIEDALLERGLPVYRPQTSDFREDMATLQCLKA